MMQLVKKSFLNRNLYSVLSARFSRENYKEPKRVAITGAAGQIGYSLVFRIAKGNLLGPNQPVILHLLDIPVAQDALNGVKMELNDCAFPLLAGVVCTDKPSVGFKDIDYALLVGAKPRGPGMERGDLLKDNGKIFVETGKALNDNANRNAKILVVGNPANTNCLIAMKHAKDMNKKNFTAMTRLDHNRALYQIANKANCHISEIEKLCIWGNHSSTMYPDITSSIIKGKKASEVLSQDWVNSELIPVVQQRGAAIIKARKLSSAASAANAAMDHIRDWALGCNGWTSMAVPSNGEYGIDKDLIFSFPVTCQNGDYKIVENLKVDDFSRKLIKVTEDELKSERKAVEGLI